MLKINRCNNINSKELVNTFNTKCNELFKHVKNYLVLNSLDELRCITGDNRTTFENYPYPYDKENVLEFSQGRCQDSSKIMGSLLLKEYHGYFDPSSKRFKIQISNKNYFLDYTISYEAGAQGPPTEKHAFLKITNETTLEQILLDPSYKQFAAVKNPKENCINFYEYCNENEQLKKEPSVYVGTIEDITLYFKESLPKTKRDEKDQNEILTIWKEGIPRNETLVKYLNDISLAKKKIDIDDLAASYLANII